MLKDLTCFNVITQTHTDLIFLQGNLAHLSVSHKGAFHFIHPLAGSHPDDVIYGQVSSLLTKLTLEHTHTQRERERERERERLKHIWASVYFKGLKIFFYFSLRGKHFKGVLALGTVVRLSPLPTPPLACTHIALYVPGRSTLMLPSRAVKIIINKSFRNWTLMAS